MGYSEILERIHALNKFGSRPGLDRVRMLLQMMGNPQDELEFIHVAGTNGKGSVCAILSSVLKASGYKTGLFTSPYITDFCERIQINNIPVSHGELAQVAEYAFSFVEKLNAQDIIITEFEFVTAVGFECFRRAGCEVVVLEVGLGGRLDSTNVINPPLCCVLTSLSLDHTDVLGDTPEKIAYEKCGIIKEGTRVAATHSLTETDEVIRRVCKEKGVPLSFSDALPVNTAEGSLKGTPFEYKGQQILLPLAGNHQVQNLKTALCALELLRDTLDRVTLQSIKEGVESARHPARFEVISSDPAVVIDGAHNPDGMRAFAQGVKSFFPNKKGVLVIGMLADKDSRSSLLYIEGLFDAVYTVPIDNPRAMSSAQMAQTAREHFENVTPCDDVQKALLKAFELAKKKGVHLCVCGSLYLAGQIRPYALRYCADGQ
ncbi:MAG: bifunctional folylpolyglutamate synthase/dihydrofolate synthase [Ruminococcus sp.]|nr:bifunctional folylpolyglutamate synthase/dihydrofolate synthase [Ruminococcus sp.]